MVVVPEIRDLARRHALSSEVQPRPGLLRLTYDIVSSILSFSLPLFQIFPLLAFDCPELRDPVPAHLFDPLNATRVLAGLPSRTARWPRGSVPSSREPAGMRRTSRR